MSEAAVDISFDVEELDQALEETGWDMRKADVESVTYNAKQQLFLAVRGFHYRTGNLRSSATDVWKFLGMKGRPMTNLSPGEKTAMVKSKDGQTARYIKLKSSGTYEDRRKQENPAFKYDLYAAEWREQRNRDPRSLIEKVMDQGMLHESEVRAVMRMSTLGSSYAEIYKRIVDMLLARGKGITITDGGNWRPYSYYKKGSRALVTPGAYKFRFEHRKVMEKHSGK